MPRKRIIAIWDEVQMRRYLRADCDPQESYPGWWSWDAIRHYFCIATGGHKWGEPYVDTIVGGQGLVVACKKCGVIWANYGSLHQNDATTVGLSNTSASNTTFRFHV